MDSIYINWIVFFVLLKVTQRCEFPHNWWGVIKLSHSGVGAKSGKRNESRGEFMLCEDVSCTTVNTIDSDHKVPAMREELL